MQDLISFPTLRRGLSELRLGRAAEQRGRSTEKRQVGSNMMEWADRTRHFGIRSRLILLFTAFAILFFVFLPISAYYLAGPNSVVVQRVGNIGEYSLSGPSGSATFLVSLYAGSAEYVKSVNFLTVLLP